MNKYELIHKLIGKKNLSRLNLLLAVERKKVADKIPKRDLSELHLSNLRVIENREKMLDLMPQKGIVAEVGVAFGDFSEEIMNRTNPHKLHLIDYWKSDIYSSGLNTIKEKFKNELENEKIEINHGLSINALEKFKDDYFDWVYIDTDHTYLTTKKELEICKRKIKKGGIIAGHDYIVGNWTGGIKYGVIEAVHEFCFENNWEIIYLTHESHGHLSFSIREIEGKNI